MSGPKRQYAIDPYPSSRFVNPIYDAPFIDQLKDLQNCVSMALSIAECPTLMQDGPPDEPSVKPREFAIGNWIVRPRFKVDEH